MKGVPSESDSPDPMKSRASESDSPDPMKGVPSESDSLDPDPDCTAVSPWNVSNLLSGFRLIGSPLLLVLAYGQLRTAFLAWLVLLMFSDWLDGKLAVAWKLRTELGARLDSVADAAMYGALGIGAWLLMPEFVWREAGWMLAAIGSFGLTATVGLIKFGRTPSYHTLGAKISWFLTAVGTLVAMFDGPAWPFRVAMVAVTLTNLEATAISLVLPRWQADVRSLYHAWRRK